GAVSDADDVQILAEALGDAAHGVGDEAAREAVELAELRVVLERPRLEMIPLDVEPDARRQRLPQLALGSLNLHGARLDVDLDAFRDRARFFAYTRHVCFLLPASSFRLPASGFRLPASGFQRLATSCSLRVPTFKLPMTCRKLEAGSRKRLPHVTKHFAADACLDRLAAG